MNERDGVRKYTYKVSEKKLTELIEVMMTTYEINITEKEFDAVTHETDLPTSVAKKSKAEQKLRSFQHREKFLERQMSELNRRERVHRLCTRAGMLESFLVCPGELTDDQVMELLKISFRQPEVVLALAKMVHDVHECSNVQNPLE